MGSFNYNLSFKRFPQFKWLPHPRIVDDDFDKYGFNDEIKDSDQVLEYRDEANRRWWSFFNEYEYRLNANLLQKRSWYHWYPKGAPKQETKVLMKLDVLIGLFTLLLNWVRALDSSNLNQAYVSGMKEEIGMVGNDLNHTTVVFTVGAIVFQLPFMYLTPRFQANYLLFFSIFFWGIFTLGCYFIQNTAQLQVCRFFVGVGEGAIYPQVQILLSNWYVADELGRRAMIFFLGQSLGGITASLTQGAIFKTLDGHHGVSGWRYAFLIDFAITIPVAVLALFLIPGSSPYRCNSLILTDNDIRTARKRLRDANVVGDGAKPLQGFFDKKVWKKVFTTPTFYLLLVLDTCSWNNMVAYSGSFVLWLKSLGIYSIVKVNNYSSYPACLGIAYVVILSTYSDLFRSRWSTIVISCSFNIISCSILMKWDVSSSAKWFAFLTTYFSVAASPCLWSFMNDFLRHDAQTKAITWLSVYTIAQSTNAWIPTLVWQTVDSPKFFKGYTTANVFTIIYMLWVFVVLWYYKKLEKRNALANGIYLYNSAKGEFPPDYKSDRVSSDDDKKELNLVAGSKDISFD